MPKEISSKTGSAPIEKMGHTANNNHGSDPNLKPKGETKPRDLSIK